MKREDAMSFPFAYKCLWLGTLVVCVSVATYFLYGWFTLEPALEIGINMPGQDGRPEGFAAEEDAVDLRGVLETFEGVPASLPGEWPRFRGKDYDNIAKDIPALDNEWPPEGPPVLWSIELGEGHAAPVVQEGRVYVLDYDEEERADSVRCFLLADGRELWRHSYKVTVKRNHGMSRTVPALANGRIVTIGPRCHVVCLDAQSGAFQWGMDLQREYGTTEPLWYTGQCPLIDGDTVILAPCGPETLMMGVDLASGAVLWKTPNPEGLNMSHSSILPITLADIRMYVYSAIGAVVGVGAEGNALGQLLWQSPWKARVIAPSPLKIAGDRLLAIAGYGEGNQVIRLTAADGVITPEVISAQTPKEGIACEQQTPIAYNGLLYAIMPKDAGSLREQFVCYHPEGELLWSSGAENRYGLGPFVLADEKFYILSDDGVLTMLDANATSYVQLAKARIMDGHDAWGPIAVAGSRILLRDSKRMVCIEAAAKNKEQRP